MARPIERVEIVITGRVQGVGFRYFTLRAAQPLDIKGWVKNMPDGSVLLWAQGEPEKMARFRDKLKRGPLLSKVARLRERSLTREEAQALSDFQILN